MITPTSAAVTAGAIRLASSRSVPASALLGVAVGLVALYSSWVTFVYALGQRALDQFAASIQELEELIDAELAPEDGGAGGGEEPAAREAVASVEEMRGALAAEAPDLVELALQPGRVWQTAVEIADTGWYTVRGVSPRGAALWSFWALEALLLVGLPVLVGVRATRAQVFCENCRRRASERKGLTELRAGDREQLRAAFEHRDWDVLRSFGPPARGDERSYRVDAHVCDGCHSFFALTLTAVGRAADAKRGTPGVERAVLARLLVSSADYDAMRHLHDTPADGEAAPRSPALEVELDPPPAAPFAAGSAPAPRTSPADRPTSAGPRPRAAGAPPAGSRVWFYEIRAVAEGPVTEERLRSLLASGELSASNVVWRPGMPDWRRAGEVLGTREPAPSGRA